MGKGGKPSFKNEGDGRIAQKIYNEVMVRHVIGYANFPHEDILREGLSSLLSYPEFNDATALANSLSLLEDQTGMQSLLRTCALNKELTIWIGDELCPLVPKNAECAVIAVPYKINQMVVGAIALLGPMRLPYKELFSTLSTFSEKLSQKLTASVYKYKITFRQPTHPGDEQIKQECSIQIEDKSRRS